MKEAKPGLINFSVSLPPFNIINCFSNHCHKNYKSQRSPICVQISNSKLLKILKTFQWLFHAQELVFKVVSECSSSFIYYISTINQPLALLLFFYELQINRRMTTFIKTKFKISDDQTNIDKYRLAANITEYHIILKLILQ